MASERYKWKVFIRPNSDGSKDDGRCCSSDEAFVMRVERRTSVKQLKVF
jgi:hypothetical protein